LNAVRKHRLTAELEFQCATKILFRTALAKTPTTVRLMYTIYNITRAAMYTIYIYIIDTMYTIYIYMYTIYIYIIDNVYYI